MICKIGLPGATVTFPAPSSEMTRRSVKVGASRRAVNGTLVTHYVAVKYTWSLTWHGLTTAEKDALLVELRRLATLSWEPPTGGSYSVVAKDPDDRLFSPTPRWQVSVELEEV